MGPEELKRQADLEDRHFWYAGRRRQVRQRLDDAPAGGRALDLGAGSGGNTALLVQAGYRTTALEHHPVAAQLARARGADVVRADAHALPFPDQAFDLVLACDVLEHLEDDTTAVAEVRRVLRPGGRLLCTVPADPRLWSDHDVALHHHRRYTADALQDVLTRGGLEVDRLDEWMVLLRPLVALRRRTGGRQQAAHTPEEGCVSDLEDVAAPVNAVLSAVLRLEDRLPRLGRLRGRGVSLIAVSRRPAA